MSTLRPYQREALDHVYEHWDSDSDLGAMLVMSTGTGKTRTALQLVVDAIERGDRVVWLAHRSELLDQPMRDLAKTWPQHAAKGGVVQADRNAADAQVVFASIDTLRTKKRRDLVLSHGPVGVLVVDEAHHSMAKSHRKVIDAMTGPDTLLLGLTATPDREDGADLGEHWEIVFSYGLVDAIRDGFLVPPFAVVERLANLDLSKVSGRRDYDDAALGRELLIAGIVEHTVKQLGCPHVCEELPDRERTKEINPKGRSGMVFTATVEQARLTAAALREVGWTARYICAETPPIERRRILRAFRVGDVFWLCNAAVLTEGTDLPRASVIVLARPTKSWSLAIQMIGRGLRLNDGKEDCMILDLAGATDEHNLISAPVLIGGSRCPKSPNGIHQFEPMRDSVKGFCVYCERKIPCYQALAEGGAGLHVWLDDEDDGARKCRVCRRAQCEGSVDGRHNWVPIEDFKRVCIDCDLELPDPHASMIGVRQKPEAIEVKRLVFPRLRPEIWAVDIADHGLLFAVRDGDGWRSYWVKKGGRIARALSRDPIRTEQVREFASSLLRRARRYHNSTARVSLKQQEYAHRIGASLDSIDTAGGAELHLSWSLARKRALALGLAQEAA